MRLSVLVAPLLLASVPSGGFGQEPRPKGESAAQDKVKPLARLIPVMKLKVTWEKGANPLKPAIITSPDNLPKSPVVKDAADDLKKRVDFAKEKLVVFAWQGRPKEVVGPTASLTEGQKQIVLFTFTPAGATKGSVEHIYIYAVPRDAEVRVKRSQFAPK